MPEALARFRGDAFVSGSARAAENSRFGGAWRLLRGLMPARARSFAGAALAATMVGIVVNAVTFQHARHPNPLFAASPPAAAPVAVASPPEAAPPPVADPAPAAASAPAPARSAPPSSFASSGPPAPPIRPSGFAATSQAIASRRSADPIADILREGVNKDSRRLLATAQSALIRLGYPIKTGGAPGADISAALREFEKSHGLPVSTEITPRLVKLLEAAATSASAR